MYMAVAPEITQMVQANTELPEDLQDGITKACLRITICICRRDPWCKDLTGPFTGKASLKSNWGFNDLVGIEGHENRYRIYRNGDTSYEDLLGQSKNELQEQHETLAGWKNIYTIRHMTENKVVKFKDLKDALMGNGNGTATEPANVYQEDGAMAVLMDNTPTNPTESEGQEAAPDIQDPCKDLN